MSLIVFVRTGCGRLSELSDREVKQSEVDDRVDASGSGTTVGSHMTDQLLWSFNDAMLNSIARQICILF